MIEYGAILLLGAMAAAVGAFMLFANSWWGPRRPNPSKSLPFECGRDPIAMPAGRLPVHFYVIAMLFVVLDVEIVFLFPWAVLARELGWLGLVEIGLFMLIVIAGFAYAWREGALDLLRRRPGSRPS
ncbi:MAG TPA: NADH-quinone oxidoreductase subunit A [bacterium]